MKAFVLATYVPLLNDRLASPSGISFALRLGVKQKEKITPAMLAPYQDPFKHRAARKALIKTGHSLHPDGFKEIAKRLPTFEAPVLCLYGQNDRILPDVAKTMARVKGDLPHAEIQSIADCGHFLQEDEPEEVGRRIAAFLV